MSPNGKVLTPEWIAKHNESVNEFWQTYEPLIKALSRADLRRIIRFVQNDFLSIQELGRTLRHGKLPFTWEEKDDLAMGLALYRHALKTLDSYDDDFRPRR